MAHTEHDKRRCYRRGTTWFEWGDGPSWRLVPTRGHALELADRVSIDSVTCALTRVLLGFLKTSAELNSMRIAHGPHWLPVITVSAPGRGWNRIFSEAGGGGLEVN